MEVESILLAVVHIDTYASQQILSSATGFYFRYQQQLYLITNRHVVRDENNCHYPDKLEITLHPNRSNLAETSFYSIPFYDNAGKPIWREVHDWAGIVDVVALPLMQGIFPENALYTAFTPANLPQELMTVEIGQSVRVVGYPLNFHDTLHNLPVMRHAIIASSFNLRFQGKGYFLTDSLLHRGSSGSPVIMRTSDAVSGRTDFPWTLLGIHSARLSAKRDIYADDRLNLFATWYSDVLLKLTG